ncbi:NAD(P)H-hydrate epimerase [Trichomonascus vanleenenianus]|uniref:NADHX epimerase n=1 Tax=Trichomonascus vanleenenianus TaxID=2268995 RepID=UPI003ECA9709
MSLKYLTAQAAAAVDKELMSSGAFSIDQLMELAGLSVAQAVYKVQPPEPNRNNVLILAGPGNNGGDGLVAARHLYLLGYRPSIYYPKKSKGELFERLEKQLRNFGIQFVDDVDEAFRSTNHIIDALFGFSFKPPLREPFPAVISKLKHTKVPVTSVDIPSSWNVDEGPIDGNTFHPDNLVSLTAPKPAAKYFRGRHFIGGRFVSKEFAEKYGFSVPDYPGIDQVVEVKNQ